MSHKHWNTPEIAALRKTAVDFSAAEILPYQDQWEEDGQIPRELSGKAGKLGLLGLAFPTEAGGEGAGMRESTAVA
ncbi:MAG: acyl-CoA dehydrogenase family protein, partial [Corynebacterium sp.]|nr:acyl-CoA dehydrogenase family protein [Corynebacterium sp.]